ncbi:MAG: tyrosine-protein phosphatase [Sphingobium sp.]
MRMIALPVAALLLVPGCKQADAPQAQQQALAPAEYNEQALADERRVLDLEGGRNFRDLGGYRTEDGQQQVKWRTVFRSGTPAHLTEKDIKTLGDLGIRSFCDLRNNEEREAEPNPFVAANSNVDYWTRDYRQGGGDLRGALGGPDASAEKSRARMTGLYRTLPEEHAESYREMFRRLAAGQTPLAFNCSGGKDRVGVGAALILTVLGVPKATVVADYALSDDVVDYRKEMENSASKNPSYSALAKLPWEMLEPLLASDPAYIESALDALTQKYGSVEAFIEQELQVTPEMKKQIRANLLEPVGQA